MAMRMSGLMSGLDTESIIQQLVEAKSTKVTTAKKAQTKLSWQQEAWKELNTKLQNLQSKFLSSMRFSTAYTQKVTKVSNSSAVSVITGENAVDGVQELQVNKLAKTAYLTGGVVSAGDGSDVTALTKISDLDGFSGSGRINVTTGSTSVDINITENTTISDVLTQLKNAGLNASFDAKWGRFSISSKESGKDNDFSITALDKGGADALSAMQIQVNDEATMAEYNKYAGYYVAGDRDATLANMKSMIDADVASRTESYLNQYKSLTASRNAALQTIADINGKYSGSTLDSADNYASQIETKNKRIEELTENLNAADSPYTEDDRKAAEEEIAKLQGEVADLSEKKADAESLAANRDAVTNLDGQIADVKDYITVQESTDADGNVTYEAEATSKLTGEVEDRYYDKAEMAADVIANQNNYFTTADPGKGATKVSGQDAEITLNGAIYTNSNNVFEINGLTFTALAETKGESVTVTTSQDVDGIYDLVKNFLKEYNAIINEMDKLYNADSASGYEPLSDEEKEVMSESDIEKYEQKIKDALLRRDENLYSVSSAMKSVMSSGIDVNGKTMYLFDFGIETLSYMVAADNEKNAYHIAGDSDDGYTSGDADKLRSMIANDPNTVITFFTKLSQNLYDKMSDLSKSVDGYRSFGSFYDDKKMKTEYDDYTTKIAELEEKLNDYEDKWYAKFAAMETAMAKMQQNANAVTALLGGS